MSLLGHHPTRKLGVRPPNPDKVARGVLDLTPHLVLDAVVPVFNYLDGTDWASYGCFGNDQAGDCEVARLANWLILINQVIGSGPVVMTMDQVWAVYQTQNQDFTPDDNPDTGFGSSADGGMDTQTLCEDLQDGMPDGTKLICFGTVDPTNEPAVIKAIEIFGGVWVDILVEANNQNEFDQGLAWDNSDPNDIEGGHAVLGGGAIPQRLFVTWAQICEFAESFWNGTTPDGPCVSTVWVPVHQLHLGTESFEKGVTRATLESAYTALTGDPFPAPTPAPPAPPPDPLPVPVPPAPSIVVTDPGLVARLSALAAKHEMTVVDYLTKVLRRVLRDAEEFS